LDAKIEKMHPQLFYKACTEKTSKICLNLMANSFICGRKNGDRHNAPRTSVIYHARWKPPKCIWT